MHAVIALKDNLASERIVARQLWHHQLLSTIMDHQFVKSAVAVTSLSYWISTGICTLSVIRISVDLVRLLVDFPRGVMCNSCVI